jgi:hypothetical protein
MQMWHAISKNVGGDGFSHFLADRIHRKDCLPALFLPWSGVDLEDSVTLISCREGHIDADHKSILEDCRSDTHMRLR